MRARAVSLGAQAACLGISSAMLIVASTSLFLTRYGAGLLPVAYLVVAAAGVAVTAAMSAAQRRLSLAGLVTAVLSAVALAMAAGWAALSLLGWEWASFPLVVLIFLWIPVGFVLVGSQAGRLLDVQQLKAWFPRIAAGFAAGFGVGGLLAARLVAVLGDPADLLLVGTVVVAAFLVLALLLARACPAELRSPPEPAPERPAERVPLRRLLDDRLVVALLGYQLLSAAVTQLLDYLVWSSAAARYPDPVELARFLGLFGAVINGVGLLFVFTAAGWLLSRYGVRFGLAANPVGVLVLVCASTAVALAGGAGTTLLFVLICAQQVVDIALTDGTTRGSINAAYQALPPRERLAAQTRVEGAGVPAATGAVGLLLLVGQLVGAGTAALLVVVLVLTVLWLGLALSAYRHYAVDLRRTIQQRAWDPVALRLDDDASRAIVDRLLAGDDPRDVAVAVDALAAAAPETLAAHVVALVSSPDDGRSSLGVDAARRHGIVEASGALLALAADRSRPGGLRASAALAAASLGAGREPFDPLLDDAEPHVRTAAAVALVRAGGTDDVDRAAGLAAEGEPDLWPMAALLPAPAWAPLLETAAARTPAAPGLADALVAHADHLVPAAARALADGPARAAELLVRAVASSPSPAAQALLLGAFAHPDLDVRDAVVAALAARGPSADKAPMLDALHAEAARAGAALAALDRLRAEPGADLVVRALRDDLDGVRERAVGLVGALHGPGAARRAAASLAGASRPLALEWLEVALGHRDCALVLALVDPALDDDARRRALAVDGPAPDRTAAEWLDDLALDTDARWHDPWLRAAAVHALGQGSPARTSAASDPDPVVRETALAR